MPTVKTKTRDQLVHELREKHSVESKKPATVAQPATANPPPKGDKKLEALLAKFKKKYKDDVLTTIASSARAAGIKTVPSGWQEMDDLITGETDAEARTIKGSGLGWPRGRIIEIFGQEGCLSSDMFIAYQVRHPNGDTANHKGGTIERLYERFHGLPASGDRRGKYNRKVTDGCDFFAPSVNEEGRIFQNRIVGVVHTGERECFEVETESGNVIVATADHKVLNNNKYVCVSDLHVGMRLYKHDNTPFTCETAASPRRPEWLVKHHPYGTTKIVHDVRRGYENTYKRISRSRALMEARVNGLSPATYRRILNSNDWDKLDGLKFIDPEFNHIHHINEDGTDDRIENMVVVDASEHLRQHAIERHNNLRFMVTEDEIVSIKNVGKRPTYDLKMEAPYNNYVANGLVVHNSGKTSTALQIIAAFQRVGERCAFVDAEHALDVAYAKKLGVDLTTLQLSQPDSGGERALDVVREMCASGLFGCIVVDSVSALVPGSELEADFEDNAQPARQAALMSRALRRLTSPVSQNDVLLVFINQQRVKLNVRFGNPRVTSGGESLKYYASIRMELVVVKTVKKGDRVLFRRTRVRTVKNKVAAPFRDVYADVAPNKGISAVHGDPDFEGGSDDD